MIICNLEAGTCFFSKIFMADYVFDLILFLVYNRFWGLISGCYTFIFWILMRWNNVAAIFLPSSSLKILEEIFCSWEVIALLYFLWSSCASQLTKTWFKSVSSRMSCVHAEDWTIIFLRNNFNGGKASLTFWN